MLKRNVLEFKKKILCNRKCAIILKEDEVAKVLDFPMQKIALRKDPNVKILEVCGEERIDEKLLYWDRIIHYDLEQVLKEEEEFLKNCSNVLHKFRSRKNKN